MSAEGTDESNERHRKSNVDSNKTGQQHSWSDLVLELHVLKDGLDDQISVSEVLQSGG